MDNLRNKFGKIYDKYIEKIYRFVYLKVNSAQVAEDLTSETFLKTWEFFKKDKQKINNINAFLYKTAKNLVIDHYRQRGKIRIVSTDDISIVDPRHDLEKDAKINSDVEWVRKCIDGLKDDYQDVIILRYIDDLPISEIARIMGRTNGATRTLLHRALKSLKDEVKEV